MSGLAPRTDPGRASPADQRTIRDHNLSVVLDHILEHGPSTRALIASASGLNKTTVSSLVSELVERRVLRDGDLQHSGSAGRPATTVELDGDVWVAIGMEVNVESVAWAAVDLTSRVRTHQVVAMDNRGRDPGEVLAQLAELVEAGVGQVRAGGMVPIAANLALPGLVDADQRHLLIAPNLHWRDVPAADIMQDRLRHLGLPVKLDNEANLAALAEHRVGAGRSIDSFLHVSGEVGVGAGIILDGRVNRGALGFGGELGHVTMDANGARCTCGAMGCVETFVGLNATLRRAGFDPQEVLRQASGTDSSPADVIVSAALSGDQAVIDSLDTTGHLLGTALSIAVNLLSPQAVILGGYFTALHPWLAPAVRDELSERVLASRVQPMEVLPSELHQAAAVRGAAAMALADVLVNPATFAPT